MLIQPLGPDGSIAIQTPAKLNLVLEILGKRSDGYHQVSTVMCPVTLWDSLVISPQPDSQISLEVVLPDECREDDPAWQIPLDSSNLVVKAAEAVRWSLGIRAGCRIRLTKRIPAAAGLGGASSNAAATVVACMLLWSQWNRSVAADLCQRLGSDVNFFLGSPQGVGMMVAEGRGELTNLISSKPGLAFWLTHPPTGCSTKEVYARVLQTGNLGKTREFLVACETGQESKIGAAMFNALQSPASAINGWISTQLELLASCGCSFSQMSGSGSSCFGFKPKQGNLTEVILRAREAGIARAYRVDAWYGESIEQQIAARRSG